MELENLRSSLATREFGKVILLFQKIESTQALALQMLQDPDSRHGTVIISLEQNSGVGRNGSEWISPLGGLWMSIIIRPSFKIENGLLLQIVAALAVQQAIESFTGLDSTIKWPNDVMIKGKKVCGIIANASYESATLTFAVVGVGVNVNFNDYLVNDKIKPKSYAKATSLLTELGHKLNLEVFARLIIEKFEYYYLMLEQNPVSILKNWKKHTDIIGREVVLIDGTNKIVGKAIDIQMDGGLLLENPNGQFKVVSGSIYLP